MQNYDVGSTSIVKLAFVYEQINTGKYLTSQDGNFSWPMMCIVHTHCNILSLDIYDFRDSDVFPRFFT